MDRHAAHGCLDLAVVVLAIAVRIFPHWPIVHPVPVVLERPVMPDIADRDLGSGLQTRDLVSIFFLRLALVDAMAVRGDDRHVACPWLHDPFRCWHDPLALGDVAPPFDLSLAGSPAEPPAVAEPIATQPKPFAAILFDGDQEVGVAGAVAFPMTSHLR